MYVRVRDHVAEGGQAARALARTRTQPEKLKKVGVVATLCSYIANEINSLKS